MNTELRTLGLQGNPLAKSPYVPPLPRTLPSHRPHQYATGETVALARLGLCATHPLRLDRTVLTIECSIAGHAGATALRLVPRFLRSSLSMLSGCLGLLRSARP
jgi:hypothetical protein